MAYKRTVKPNSRPYRWCTGPDLLTHLQYRAFVQQRNQAVFRQEPWQLTLEEYQDLWRDHWAERGRTRDSYMMTRVNPDRPWSWANTVVITRQQHGARQAAARVRGCRSGARVRELNSVEQSE